MSTTFRSNGCRVFVSDLKLTPTSQMSGRRRVYMLDYPFHVVITANGVHQKIYIPAGFKTDFATIPLIAQVFLGGRDDPGVAEAGVVHDWLCAADAPRELANTTFYWLTLALGVPRWKAVACYLALCFFGYKSFLSRSYIAVQRWLKIET